jgi:FMN phosphatase YigB (HAD superfamily)
MVTKIQVFLASGRLGSGKNFITENILLPMLPPQPTLFLAFANHFKIEAIVKDHLERDKVFGEKDAPTRRALQLRGTEEGRDVYGEDIWLDLGLEWLYMYLGQGYTRFIFTDARFPNEVEKVMALDGTQLTVQGKTYQFECVSIRALAPLRSQRRAQQEAAKNNIPVEAITGHLSETALDGYTRFTYQVCNDLTDDVFPVIKGIARELTQRFAPDVCYVVDVDDTLLHCGQYYEDAITQTRTLIEGFARTYEQVFGKQPGSIVGMALAGFHVFQRGIYARQHKGVFRRETFAEDLREAYLNTLKAYDLLPLATHTFAHDELGENVYELGMGVFDQVYPAIDGALDALVQLQNLGAVVLNTHGDRIEQMSKIARAGLSRLPVHISPDKGAHTLRELMALYPAHSYVAFGDNYKRDAEAALANDFARIYWIDLGRKVQPTGPAKGITRVASFQEAVKQELSKRVVTVINEASAQIASTTHQDVDKWVIHPYIDLGAPYSTPTPPDGD